MFIIVSLIITAVVLGIQQLRIKVTEEWIDQQNQLRLELDRNLAVTEKYYRDMADAYHAIL